MVSILIHAPPLSLLIALQNRSAEALCQKGVLSAAIGKGFNGLELALTVQSRSAIGGNNL